MDTIHKLPRVERFGDRSIEGRRYTDPEQLELEMDLVFRPGWVVGCPLWQVSEPGSWSVLNETSPFSVVVTRDTNGKLHAFRNACVHRGSSIVKACGKGTALRCAYHGWSYSLDGQLREVPRAEGFGGVDPHAMRLKTVSHAVFAGMVWINLSENAEPLASSLSGIDEDLQPYALSEMEPIQERVFSVPVNWKSMMENAFDYYHAAEVHRHTIHAHVDSTPELAILGDHMCQNLHIAPYKWRRMLDEHCSRGGPYSERQMSRLFKYTIFPNTIINVLPYHLTVMRFWPDGVGRTRLHYAFCQRRGARGIERLRAWGTWLASRVILAEDVRMLVRCQQDLDSDAVPHHLLHDYEAAAAHFHGVLNRQLSEGIS